MDISSRHHIPPPSPVSLKADLLQFIFIFLLTDPYFPLLMPISARRQLFDLPDELATKISIEFYSDSADALLKAVVE